MLDRKAMLRQYKETPRPAGLFGVRNIEDDRLLIGFSVDLPAMLNRQRFQLEMGLHPDNELQADWHRCGSDVVCLRGARRTQACGWVEFGPSG